ncbi:MAG: polysaccharide deacetylase family protein [Bacteroidales bacterium]|nr:polysaccharide deacetylase family protein [Candidatus Liminaster caballi]
MSHIISRPINTFHASPCGRLGWAVGGAVISLLLSSCSGIEISSVEVTPYLNDKASAISFTFDDGMLCHYTDIAPELENRDMRGTFWIIGANMDSDVPDYPWMTWTQVKELADRGHEISNHAWNHPDLTAIPLDSVRWEVAYNDSVIESVTGRKPRTFCYPYNAMNDEVIAICEEGRVGSRTYWASHGQAFSHQTADSLTLWLHDVISHGRWGVTMTHGTTYGWDMWNEPQVLYSFFDEVKAASDSVWVGTFEEVAAYTREAADAVITDIHAGRGEASFTPSLRTLSADLYDQPLTFCVNGSFSANGRYQATQDGKPLAITAFDGYLLINALPNGTKVTIKAN